MNILLIDDHPMTVEGYKSALLKYGSFSTEPVFTTAQSCDQGIAAISKALVDKVSFDVAILDQGLPSSSDNSVTSGSDLALLIQEKMPSTKIVMITAHTEVIIIFEIVKKIKPNGLVIKNDLSPEDLPKIVSNVLKGENYYSPMVKSCVNEIWKKELMIDDYNRQILLYLSKGFKMKELDGIVALTTSSIQKRVKKMKSVFEVEDDSGLVKEAIIQGFI